MTKSQEAGSLRNDGENLLKSKKHEYVPVLWLFNINFIRFWGFLFFFKNNEVCILVIGFYLSVQKKNPAVIITKSEFKSQSDAVRSVWSNCVKSPQ